MYELIMSEKKHILMSIIPPKKPLQIINTDLL